MRREGLQRRVHFLVPVVEDEGAFALECLALGLPLGEVDEVLEALAQLGDDLLVLFQLPTLVLHGVENEDALGDVVVLVRREPVGKHGVRRLRVPHRILFHVDTRRS